LFYVFVQGAGAINWTFLTHLPAPVGVPGGGVGNGIWGTVIIIAIAMAMAIPVGLLTAIYLALFGRGAIPEALRFLSDVLSGVPSIAIGLFAYARRSRRFVRCRRRYARARSRWECRTFGRRCRS
jgi:phosphate transport system permease protein